MSIIVITGATSGVGRACARLAASQGNDVGLLARSRLPLEDVATEVRALGRKAIPVLCDVADAAAVDASGDLVVRELGGIDVWINNAMVTVLAPVTAMTAEEYRRVTEVTYLGYVHGSLTALRHMRLRDAGVIVQVGSALAYRSIPLQSAYCAAKAAIRGFHESLRCELLNDRSQIASTMVQLPAINTPQFDVGRNKLPHKMRPVAPVFTPELAAEAILHAAEHPGRESLVAGSSMRAVWGQRLAPALLEKLAARTAATGQQTDEIELAGRADNLFEPVGRDFGAEGRFSDEAKERSIAWSVVRSIGSLTSRRYQAPDGDG
jgi:NAD(P)-dependent dehydrogenase (short-subunit alcohol dehydrogenase family)